MDDLVNGIVYVVFKWGDGSSFYIKTSINPIFCKTSTEALYDLNSNRWLEKRIFQNSGYKICKSEPIELKDDSKFWMEVLGIDFL